MQRVVTAIYRTWAVADLVRSEIADLGVSRGHIHVVPDSDTPVTAGATRDDHRYSDDLHDLHLPENDLRSYQQAVRRGDYVVSANVDEDHLPRVTEIMRRPEDAYDLDATDIEFAEVEYVPHSSGTYVVDEDRVGTRDTTTDPYVRSYSRRTALDERKY